MYIHIIKMLDVATVADCSSCTNYTYIYIDIYVHICIHLHEYKYMLVYKCIHK